MSRSQFELLGGPETPSSGKRSSRSRSTRRGQSSKSISATENSDAPLTTACTLTVEDGFGPKKSAQATRSSPAATKPCERCGKDFHIKKSHAARRRFCSKNCKYAAKTERALQENSRPCQVCGKMVYRPPSHLQRVVANLFCSHRCHGIHAVGQNNPMYRGGQMTNACPNCQKDFHVKPSMARRAECCSITCRNELMKKRTAARNLVSCPTCGKHFVRRNCRQIRCSKECSGRDHAKMMVGMGNGRYVHGEAMRAYPPGWTRNYRKKIRARDGNACVMCGMSQALHGKLLCVHHIDYDKDNLDQINLMTLCRFCHGKLHGSRLQRAAWQEKLSAVLRTLVSSGQTRLMSL